jgi:hypothetical protein
MSDGYDFNVIAAHPIHETEREAWEHVPSGPAAVTRPCERIACDHVDRVFQFLTKRIGQARVSSGVPHRRMPPPALQQGGT